MCHGVDDIVNTDLGAEHRKLWRVTWVIQEFPGITNIRVQRKGNHDSSFVVVDSLPVCDVPIFLMSSRQMLGTGNLKAIVKIEECMKDRVVIWYVYKIAFR